MPERRLVVYEAAIAEDTEGRMFAIDPVDATGIAIPTMEFVTTLPAAGGVKGQLYYVTTSHSSYAWDGTLFEPLTPSIIESFDTDLDLLADTLSKAGAYASAKDTGNLYVKVATGWRQVGIHQYPTVVGLLADTPADGAMGYAVDEKTLWAYSGGTWYPQTPRLFSDVPALLAWAAPNGSSALAIDENTYWVRSGGSWICHSVRVLADLAAVTAWTPPDGARAFDVATSLSYFRTGGAWVTTDRVVDTEANILALYTTTLTAGQLALSSDTGKSFVLIDTAGVKSWVGTPIQHYATDAALIAASPPVGTIAFADDTGVFYGLTATGWTKAAGNTISVLALGATKPALAVTGDMVVTKLLLGTTTETYDGTAWIRTVPMQTYGLDGNRPAVPIEGDRHYQFGAGEPYPQSLIFHNSVWTPDAVKICVKELSSSISGNGATIAYQSGTTAAPRPTIWIKSDEDGNDAWHEINKLWDTAWGVVAAVNISAADVTVAGIHVGLMSVPVVAGRKYKFSYNILLGLKTSTSHNYIHTHLNYDNGWMTGCESAQHWNGTGYADNTIMGSANAIGIQNAGANGTKAVYIYVSAHSGDARVHTGTVVAEDVGPA